MEKSIRGWRLDPVVQYDTLHPCGVVYINGEATGCVGGGCLMFQTLIPAAVVLPTNGNPGAEPLLKTRIKTLLCFAQPSSGSKSVKPSCRPVAVQAIGLDKYI